MYGLLEVDVTIVRQFIAEHKVRTGETLSFTGYLAFCLAHAIDENKLVQAFLKGASNSSCLTTWTWVCRLSARWRDACTNVSHHPSRQPQDVPGNPSGDPLGTVPASAAEQRVCPWLRFGMLLPEPLARLFIALVRAANRRNPKITAAVAGTVV